MCLLHTSKLILCYFRRLRLLSSDYEEYFRNLTNQSSPVRLRPSAKENKLVVFFNWPIIVCVLLECLFLSVAMDCNLVPMDWNLVPMDCDLVPIDCSCNCAIFPQLAGFQNTPSKSRPQLLRFCLPLGLWFALWIVKLRRLPCCLPWVVGLSIVCDVFAIYMIDKQLFQNAMT